MKKKNFWVAIFAFFLLLAIVLLFSLNYYKRKQSRVCFKNYCFDVELAITPQERNRGLMFRQNLAFNQGMLFIFEKEGKHPFWMKNTLILLDIIWINENEEVVFISENTQPCEEYSCPIIEPDESAKYVLEINGGISNKIGLSLGDKISLEIE